MTSPLALVDQAEPLAEWLEPSLNDTAGRDPLGLNTITLDRILPDLIPGILQISERARYFSIYPWMLWQFAERRLQATSTAARPVHPPARVRVLFGDEALSPL